MTPDSPSRQSSTAQEASARAIYDYAVELMDNPPKVGTMRDLFEHRLGTFGYAYHVKGWMDVLRENDLYREALQEISDKSEDDDPTTKRELGIVAESALENSADA